MSKSCQNLDAAKNKMWAIKDFVNAGIKGIKSRNGVRKMLEREGVRLESTKGKKALIPGCDLPRDLLKTLAEKLCHPEETANRPQNKTKQRPLDPSDIQIWEQACEDDQKKAEAWADIKDAWDSYWDKQKSLGIKKTVAMQSFCRNWQAGCLTDNSGLLCLIPSFSARTLRRKLKDFKALGLVGFLPQNKSQGKMTVLSSDLQRYIVGLIANNPDIRTRRIFEYLKEFRAFTGSESTVRRFVKQWKKGNRQQYTFLKNPDEWKNIFQPAPGDAGALATRVNALWELDSTPGDILDEEGKRWTIIGGIDVFSRRAGYRLHESSSSEGIAQLLRKKILKYGKPDTIRIDQGKDYTSRRIKQACIFAGIKVIECPPFTPEGKPFIERAFRTLAEGLFENIKGYCGHNVAQRKAIEARKSFADRLMKKGETIQIGLPKEKIQSLIDTWTDNIYHQRTHSSLGVSPAVKAGQCMAPLNRIEDERLLDLLLAIGGTRTVSKKGVSWDNGKYWAPELAGMVGDLVQIRLDHSDAGRIYVFSTANKYICTALNKELSGITVEEATKARKTAQKKIKAEAKALKALAENTNDAMEEFISSRADKCKVTPLKRVTQADFPVRNEFEKAVEDSARIDEFGCAPLNNPENETSEPEMLNDCPVFEYAYQRYDYLRGQAKIRALTEAEKLWIKEYEDTEAYQLTNTG